MPDWEAKLRTVSLAPEKLAILTHLTQLRTVEQLCESSTLPNFVVCRTLWAYRVVGVVRRLGQTAEAGASDEDGIGRTIDGEQ